MTAKKREKEEGGGEQEEEQQLAQTFQDLVSEKRKEEKSPFYPLLII
jgi:hypothetical protein